MAITVIVAGESGMGKTCSLVVGKDGNFPISDKGDFDMNLYDGLDPKETVVFNCDGKIMPFPAGKVGFKKGENLFTSTYDKPITANWLLGNPKDPKNKGMLALINEGKKGYNKIIVDTINGMMNDKEMLETRNMSWDKWYDLAKDIYALIVKANSLKPDLIIYLLAHVSLHTDVDGEEKKGLLTNGKKLDKIKLESKAPIVLTTSVSGTGGDNDFNFETRMNRSITKTPPGLFKDFTIPNSLRLVDDRIREYYGL